MLSHSTEKLSSFRPWPNDSIFHSIFSSTFHLKVERLFSVVEHMWPNGSIFRSTFLSTFQLLIFPQRMSAKNFLPSQIFDRLTRRYCACFHSTCSTRWPNGSIFTQQQLVSSIFFDKDQTSLNITRLHSTHSTRWPNGSIFSSIFCRVKNRVKNRVVWPGR